MDSITIDDVTFRVGDELAGGSDDPPATIVAIERGHPDFDGYDEAIWLVLEEASGWTHRALAGSIAVAVHGDWSDTHLRRADE